MADVLDHTPKVVIITSVHRQAQLVMGDLAWPIIWKRPPLTPSSFWILTKAEGQDRFYIQPNRNNRYYLTPGGKRNSTLLEAKAVAWRILPAENGNFTISLPDQEEHYLCPGYDFADPADACAPVVEKYTDDMHFWTIKSPDW